MNSIPSPLLALIAAVAFASTGHGAPTETGVTNARPSCCARPLTNAQPLTDRSLYQSETRWTTDAGREIELRTLQGRPQVVAMFFTTCRSTCPVIVNDLRRLEASLPAELRAQVGFTLVSFDSERDTPEVLAAYRSTRQLPRETWTLLRGSPEDLQELSALLGVRFKQEANGQFAHSNTITVLSAGGEIVHQRQGLGTDLGATVQAVEALLRRPKAESSVASAPSSPLRR